MKTLCYFEPQIWLEMITSCEMPKVLVLKLCTSCRASLGRTPKGAYSTRGRSRHLLETPFSEPLLRTLLRTLSYCKTHRRPPSQNPSENPFPRTLPRTFSEPFSERCVAARPLRRAPYSRPKHNHNHNLGADFWEVDLDSNFLIFRVRRFSEWPGPLH